MSLGDGKAKMSKSDASIDNAIFLSDKPDDIWRKLKKARTDSLGSVTYDPQNRPEIANLLRILSAMSGMSLEEATKYASGLTDTVQFKRAVADAVIAHVEPIRQDRERLLQSSEVDDVIQSGNEKAESIARDTLDKIKTVVGLK
jgi:tryptophanyl-tRNA synthetase